MKYRIIFSGISAIVATLMLMTACVIEVPQTNTNTIRQIGEVEKNPT